MSTLVQDIRLAFRLLGRRPGFTAVVVLCLALGIGANTAVFSFVHGMLLRPLGYPDEDRLVCLTTANPAEGWSGANASIPDYEDWRAQATTFANMGVCTTSSLILTGGERPERVSSVSASANLLPTLGFEPEVGRAFGPAEEPPAHAQVALLSQSFWQRRFGGDTRTVGATITLDGAPATILGVLPASLERAWGRFDVWTPLAVDDATGGRGYGAYRVLGRLKPHVRLAQAQSELASIAARLAESYPDTNRGKTVEVRPILDTVVDHKARLAVTALTAAVALVLLIACANAANLMLARSTVRSREFAIRATLGAGRRRLARQIIGECLLLALAGGGLGVLLALWGVDVLVSLLPDGVPRRGEIAVNGPVLGFTSLLTLLTTLLFGLLPALQAGRVNLNVVLKDAPGAAPAGRARDFGRNALVAGQVAIALALLVCAGLMTRSFRLQKSDSPGFDAARVLTMRVRLPDQKYDTVAKQVSFVERATEQIRGAPGVTAAAAAHILPFDHSGNFPRVTTEDDAARGLDSPVIAGLSIITPAYFGAMGIPLLSGRDFSLEDAATGAPAVVVSERFARRHWPDGTAVGKRLKFGERNARGAWFTVVGVVGDVRRNGLDDNSLGYLYVSHAQVGGTYLAIVARTAGDPLAAASAVQSAIWAVDPEQAVYEVRSLAEMVAGDVGVWGVIAGTMSVFALVALSLAIAGLYGVVSFNVSRRTHEIGVRVALGARARDVMQLVLRKWALLTSPGVLLGLGLALGLGRALKALMYKVAPTDPLTFAGVSLLLVMVALLACYFPARRASKLDPLAALKCE